MERDTMFKYENPNRLYEVDYDCKRASERLDLFFRKRIDNDYYSDVNGGDENPINTYHVDYGITRQYKDWMWLCKFTEDLFRDMGSKADLNEFKHTLKFDFIRMPSAKVLAPHTASYLRAACSINVPIRGKTVIDLYEDHPDDPHREGRKIASHRYTSPILLNVNQFHGVYNKSNSERMVLKIHLMVLPYDRLVKSFSEPVRCFDWDPPWSYKRGTTQRI
jgi:hypothetical protein